MIIVILQKKKKQKNKNKLRKLNRRMDSYQHTYKVVAFAV